MAAQFPFDMVNWNENENKNEMKRNETKQCTKNRRKLELNIATFDDCIEIHIEFIHKWNDNIAWVISIFSGHKIWGGQSKWY